MSNNNSFGDRLKALRKSKKLTQVQVSEMIDVQQGTTGGLQESMSTVITRTPLSELIGYSSTLRTLTSGQADFTLAVDGYEPV